MASSCHRILGLKKARHIFAPLPTSRITTITVLRCLDTTKAWFSTRPGLLQTTSTSAHAALQQPIAHSTVLQRPHDSLQLETSASDATHSLRDSQCNPKSEGLGLRRTKMARLACLQRRRCRGSGLSKSSKTMCGLLSWESSRRSRLSLIVCVFEMGLAQGCGDV
jgi:hypothetical protein